MGLDNSQLEHLVGVRTELHDPQKEKEIVGLVLPASPNEQRCQYVLAYYNSDSREFCYTLILAHRIQSADITASRAVMVGELVDSGGRYGTNDRTLVMGLEALFREAGMATS